MLNLDAGTPLSVILSIVGHNERQRKALLTQSILELLTIVSTRFAKIFRTL